MKVAASTGAAHRKIIRPNSVKHEENFVGISCRKKRNVYVVECVKCMKTVTKRCSFADGENLVFYN